MKYLSILITLLLASCGTKPRVAVVVPRALPLKQAKADVAPTREAVRVVAGDVAALRRSSDALKVELDKAQSSQADVREQVDIAYDLGIVARSVEAASLRESVQNLASDLKAAETYGFQISSRLVVSDRNLTIVNDELVEVQSRIERIDLEREELRTVAIEMQRQNANLTKSNISQVVEVETLRASKNRSRIWVVIMGLIIGAYVVIKFSVLRL